MHSWVLGGKKAVQDGKRGKRVRIWIFLFFLFIFF